ncbi:MAG: DUF4465 domain-containing protein [Paludibacteraceae bacterium]|nr:DUF4465 domain-containing protein [Paludibacteraceae bacterium]
MKKQNLKLFGMLFCVASMTIFSSCESQNEPDDPTTGQNASTNNKDDYELRFLTFEDTDAKFEAYTLDYASANIIKWSNLIDNPQYYGSLTYTEGGVYSWRDENNTELSHSFTAPYWNGGHAISNYVISDYAMLPEGYSGWYELQFSTPLGGHNGSANFCVHNSSGTSVQSLTFADNTERVVDHMYVTNTNYFLNSLTYGDGFNPTATEETFVKIVATGYNVKGEKTGIAEFYLCRNGKCITTWEKFDLTALGKVKRVDFNFLASSDQVSEWGLSCPTYFAYDNVAVRFENE